ncbi:MAG: hypothetical protein WEC83_01650 [Patescibacteria group bacterium]
MNIDSKLVECFEKFSKLAIEAADALWAIQKGKQPDRDPLQINQDIYASHSLVEHNIRLLKEAAQTTTPTS